MNTSQEKLTARVGARQAPQPRWFGSTMNPKLQAVSSPNQVKRQRYRRIGIVLIIAALIGLGLGLGFGLARRNNSTFGKRTPSAPTEASLPGYTNGSYWKPTAGTTWQIVLHNTPKTTDIKETAFDFDLFDNTKDSISDLKSKGHKIICYFSAGSIENWRPDTSKFQKSDYGKELKDWKGEFWVDTRSENVRNVMAERIKMAADKGCDAIDPDNVDGYGNDNGLKLTEDDSVNYITFLSGEAHGRGLAMGLKNAGSIVDRVIDFTEFEVNESCVQYDECNLYRPFIDKNKPVFHIEYKGEGLSNNQICAGKDTDGFSTIIKNMELDDFAEYCPSK